MTLKQLLQRNSWLSISSVLLELYPDEEKNLEGYEDVFEKLLLMAPEEVDMTIVVKTVFDHFDGSAYVDVSGKYNHPKNEEEEFSQAIEFTPWKQWLDMDISEESLKEFTELEILAYCLYEITFAGFEEEEVQQQLDNIEQSITDYEKTTGEEKAESGISLEDFLNELMEDEQDEEEEEGD
ncbi:DUF6557 family protein [Zunongwangia sp. H14]|uniref:DUF6557 family protein n=1 Tax=Zunongwangia sp. H14 TaxID=3240792 RepID=UPI00356ADA1E